MVEVVEVVADSEQDDAETEADGGWSDGRPGQSAGAEDDPGLGSAYLIWYKGSRIWERAFDIETLRRRSGVDLAQRSRADEISTDGNLLTRQIYADLGWNMDILAAG